MVKQTLLTLHENKSNSDDEFPVDINSYVGVSCCSILASKCHPSLAESINKRILSRDVFFSMEFFPPRTKAGAANLLSRLDRVKAGGSLFCSITWHPAGNPGGDTETSSMTIAGSAFNYCGLETMLHIAGSQLTKQDALKHLKRAQSLGIRNLLTVRGDLSKDFDPAQCDFPNAVDLVRFVKENFDSYFTIAVAGYPVGHPEAPCYKKDLHHLKEKIDAGADLILTQIFFHSQNFIKFVHDCRDLGILVPIIPGIMPIQSFSSLRHMVRLSQLQVPEDLRLAIEPIKGNDEAVQAYGVHNALEMCRNILDADVAPGIHFFTLNRESGPVEVCKRLCLWQSSPQRPLPWRLGDNHRRCQEQVRPIFWASRPRAYVHRTQHWDDFPNGRWGRHDSPAFGELSDYYLFYLKNDLTTEELRLMWLEEINREEDVWNIFYAYITQEKNSQGVQVTQLAWNDGELSPETHNMIDQLAYLNKNGILTINSQPNVNGQSSTDPIVGWGAPGGYVYQKAYLEFFANKAFIENLREELSNFPTVNYHIINKTGECNYTNTFKNVPIAVTWGVFPGREIIQPTVVDPQSFHVWKDEAFALWLEPWAKLYKEDSKSYEVLKNISDSYFLVNLVDNDYPQPSCLWKLLENTLSKTESRTLA